MKPAYFSVCLTAAVPDHDEGMSEMWDRIHAVLSTIPGVFSEGGESALMGPTDVELDSPLALYLARDGAPATDDDRYDGHTTTVPCGMCCGTGVEPGENFACNWCDGNAHVEAHGQWVEVREEWQDASIDHDDRTEQR